MMTAAQCVNEAKIRLQKEIVEQLRRKSVKSLPQFWNLIRLNKKRWGEIQTYDLAAPQRQAHLNKVAFPDANHEQVNAALNAGNNLNDLYALACGRASVARTDTGQFIRVKNGRLKILRNIVLPQKMKSDIGHATTQASSGNDIFPDGDYEGLIIGIEYKEDDEFGGRVEIRYTIVNNHNDDLNGKQVSSFHSIMTPEGDTAPELEDTKQKITSLGVEYDILESISSKSEFLQILNSLQEELKWVKLHVATNNGCSNVILIGAMPNQEDKPSI